MTRAIFCLALLGSARADERDAIVAEFQQVCHAVVQRTELVTPPDAKFNTSDYHNWMRNQGDLAALYQAVLAAYRGAEVVDKNGVPYLVHGKKVHIPAAATLRIASGWRNPRRNVQVGSVVGCTSKHLLGRALDLVPDVVAGEVEGGASTALSVQDQLFPTLWNAAKLAGFAIAEVGSLPVPCGTFENHVHVHRN